MTPIFDPDPIETHDLFHARAGVGAVIAAIPKSPDAETAASRRRLGLHIAYFFNARIPRAAGSAPDFQRIGSIAEEAGFLRVTLSLEYPDPDGTDFATAWVEIDRVIPVHHVSLEFIRIDRA